MVSIKDIARIAGVSQSTVSKALNNRPDVGESTRHRILTIARELNFTPHAFGKALKKKASENIGVLFCRDLHSISGNPFYSRVLEGIEAELVLNNFNLVLQIITESTPDELPKMIRERQVDGMILVGTFREHYLNRLLQSSIPLIMIDPKKSFEGHFQVLIDNEHGAFQATQYLIDHGHRRIGFISGDWSRMSFGQRHEGYVKALKHNQIPLDPVMERMGGLENGYDLVKSLLEKSDITAFFSANDINAIYGYKAVADLGLKIPDDISIVGFDDIDLAKISSPPLTTVRVYKEELGSIAVRTLLGAISHQADIPVTTVVPTRLIERESVKTLNVSTDNTYRTNDDPNRNMNQEERG